MKGGYLLAAITADEFETPLCVARSAAELERQMGLPKNSVCASINKHASGRNTGMRFVKILTDERAYVQSSAATA